MTLIVDSEELAAFCQRQEGAEHAGFQNEQHGIEQRPAICDRLLADRDYAARIGARGAAKAAQLFRDDVIARQWNRLLKRVAAADPRRPRQGIVGRLRARFRAAS